jgi:trans-aconitate 2-methyltransferase
MKKEEVTQFYDDFVSHQLDVSFNDRHILLFNELGNLGLSAGSSVLELGCGIGVMTSLIAGVAQNGFIEAVDISPESIAEAKKRIKRQAKINFVIADLKCYTSSRSNFDLITLMDVLEHIPEEEHEELFKKISKLMHNDSVLFISIPTPHSIVYEKLHHPENVQIIDQELKADHLMNRAYLAGLELDSFRTIGIWAANDYQLITFRKKIEYTNERMSDKRSLLSKILHRTRLWQKKLLLSRNYRLQTK